MSQKRGLGRGLGALIPSTPAPTTAAEADPSEASEPSGLERAQRAETRTTPGPESGAAEAGAPRGEVPDGGAPREDAPVERASAGEAPARKEAASAPSGENARAEKTPAKKAPAKKASAKAAPAKKAPANEPPVEEASAPATGGADPAAAPATPRREAEESTGGDSLTPPTEQSPPRPSDMFFGSGSGSSAEESDDRTRRDRAPRDIAGEMAAAARTRNRRSTAGAARRNEEAAAPPPGTSATRGGAPDIQGPERDAAPPTAGEGAEEGPAAVEDGTDDGAVIRGPRDWTPVRPEAVSEAQPETVSEAEPEPEPDPASRAEAENDDRSGDSDESLLPVPGAEFAEIPIDEIRVNPKNPRADFDPDELDELAASIREVGVLQPIVVRPVRADDLGRSFEIVMGERRWRAAQRADAPRIPAIVRQTGDDDLLRDALIENLHRTQLNPLEEAAAYAQLLEDFDCSQDELADRIGRSRPQISNTLRLMRLPGLVQKRVASGALSAGHARALLPLDDVGLMEELAQRIVAEGLSVRQTEALVSRGQQPAARAAPKRSSYDPRVVDLTSQVSNRLQAPVRIDVGKRKGKMTVEFANLDDLERIIDELGH